MAHCAAKGMLVSDRLGVASTQILLEGLQNHLNDANALFDGNPLHLLKDLRFQHQPLSSAYGLIVRRVLLVGSTDLVPGWETGG
jgi:hypothetical protein